MFRVGFDYCQLRDEHGKLVECLEKKDATAAKELLASH
jgi:DNA-binding GntR family transcriptional regulator